MKHKLFNFLLACLLALVATGTKAQGLEGIIVEEFHTVTAADKAVIDAQGGSYPIPVGAKVYRVFVDMAPNYKLNIVFASPETSPGNGISPNPFSVNTTTTFWNDDNFGSEVPGQTRRFDEGLLFDSYITINTTGIAGAAAGCGSNTQQFGVLRSADTDGDLTTCGVYPAFTGNDGNIPGTGPTIVYNLSASMNFDALTDNGSTFAFIDDAWATLPASTGVDPTGTNRVLIGQFTTDGVFSFQINVQLQTPTGGLETYVHTNAGPGEAVSPFLTYPQPQTPDCEGTPGGSALPGTACNDNNACTINDIYDVNCVCTGTFQDTDGDGTCDADDGCPNDPDKVAPGICGCGVADTDTDADGTADCNDGCPNDPNKTAPGICGCGVADTDTDSDGTADCNDGCPNDPDKIAPGICGCGVADTDTDGDGTADCNDLCPNDPNKVAPGTCGCGNLEPGSACDDLDPDTDFDTINASCQCVGTPQGTDCEGTPGGTVLPGSACNDNDPCTINDIYDANCLCVGTFQDTDGDGTCDADDLCPGGPEPGTACNDGDPCTDSDVIDLLCNCVGTFQDADGDGTCDANDVCPGGPEPGTPCDDLDPDTDFDVIDANCLCVGTPAGVDCEGTPGGTVLPGSACNDNDVCTINDTYDANCNCGGTFQDSDGDGVCDANDQCPGGPEPGTACNDGDACTTGDVINASCNCVGTPVPDTDGDGLCDAIDSCPNVPGQIGSACDDGNPNTGPDVLNASCVCQGPPIGGCTENLTLSITLDAFGAQTTWTVKDAAGITTLASGGPYANGTPGAVVNEAICLPVGCYRLYMNDSGNNGISGGGYVLRDAASRRIVDANGLFTSVSTTVNEFCLPLSNQGLIASSCDRTNLVPTSTIYCGTQPGASGYQFWIFDPHGSYNRRVLWPTTNLKLQNLVTNPVPFNLDVNVRVRAQVGGVYGAFGNACRMRVNSSTNALEALDEVDLNVFPNPTRGGAVQVKLEGLDETIEHATIEVYDLFGKRVRAEQVPAGGGVVNHIMDFGSELSQGMYMVNVTIGDRIFTQRLVRQ